MKTLTGLVLQTKRLADSAVVDGVRAAYLAAGYTPAEDGASSVRVGARVEDYTLVTDSSFVTFDHDVAIDVTARLNVGGALFACRAAGEEKERAAFLALSTWKRKPPRTSVQHVFGLVAGLAGKGPWDSALWPQPWDVETRAGVTLRFTPPVRCKLFPPRTDTRQIALARRARELDLAVNQLHPTLEHQGPVDDVCDTLQMWLPAPLPPHAEAVVRCLTDEGVRREAFSPLAHSVWSHELLVDTRSAPLLLALAGEREPIGTRRRATPRSNIERAVVTLARFVVGQPVEVEDDTLVPLGVLALRHGLLPAIAVALSGAATLRERLALRVNGWLRKPTSASGRSMDAHEAAHAASILAALGDDSFAAGLDGARASAFCAALASHALQLAVALDDDCDLALRLWDVVQEHLVDDDDQCGWSHAHLLWATRLQWVRGRRRDASVARRRLDLAEQHAAGHIPMWANAIALLTAIGDDANARRCAETLRGLDRRHRALIGLATTSPARAKSRGRSKAS